MAFDFERALLEDAGPELGVVADYFLRLKHAAPTDPPDVTGALEGQFAVPVAKVLQLLAELVKNEMETVYAYTVYGQTLRDLAHDSIADHFEDHAGEEMDHAQFLLKRMAVLGGAANVPDLAAPHPSTDPCDIIQTMIRMEQEGIAGWHKLLSIVGDNPMRIKAEEYMAAEQEHLDDLWQLLKPMADPAAMVAKQAFAVTREGHELDARVLRMREQQAIEKMRMLQDEGIMGYRREGGGTNMGSFGKSLSTPVGDITDNPRHLAYAARMHEAGRNAWNPFGGILTPHDMEEGGGALQYGKIKKASSEEHEKGRASAEQSLARKFHVEKGTRGERSGDLVGRIAGAVLGGSTHALHKNPVASVGAAALGQHIGGKVGREVGRAADERRFEKKSAVFSEGTIEPSGDPADRMIQQMIGRGNFDRVEHREPEARMAWNSQGLKTKMASALKRAFDEMAGQNPNAAMAASMVPQQGEETGVEQHGALPAAPPQAPLLSDPALSSFLAADRAGTNAELQQQAAYYKQLADQAQMAADSTGQQLQQVQQQASDLQQQVMMTQQQIDQSMQQAQQIQQQAMATAQSAQQIAAQSQQAHLQAVNESMLHKQMSEQMRAGVMQMKANIQQALMGDPTQGVEMQLGPTGQPAAGPVPGQAPTAGPEVGPGGPAANAPAQELGPGEAPPNGEQQQPQAPAEAGGGPAMEGAAPSGEVKTSGAKIEALKKSLKEGLKKRGPYALAGGAAGAGLAAIGIPYSGKTKKDVDESERKGGGAVRDLNTARHKMRHAVAEYVDKHPVAGSALVGAAAANAAATAGPTVKNVIKGYLKHRKAGG